jgi:adenylosuccinate lyase
MGPINMLSPLDGRYGAMVRPLALLMSEQELNHRRFEVEVEWLVFLSARGAMSQLRPLTDTEVGYLRELVTRFGPADVEELSRIEAETRHDVKAVEYLLKRRLVGTSIEAMSEFVHFGCTSEDINNLSYARMIQAAVADVWLPAATRAAEAVTQLARTHRDVAMLSRTHGQAATPTTLGKEIAVFAHRLRRQVGQISEHRLHGKLNGATGTYSAHIAAAPEVDWIGLSRDFVHSMGLEWNPLTTQIESHDSMCELFDALARFNRVLHNLDTDLWHYISAGYFRQLANGGVGSSTMPHKINPIRFENSEANLEVSTALLRCLTDTLMTTRLQRDLSDSSMQRNIGPALGYSLIAIENTISGLADLQVDETATDADLAQQWQVLGEAVQSVMRRNGYHEPYERMKDLSRGGSVGRPELHAFIREQKLPAADERRLLALTPRDYTGLAAQLVDLLDSPAAPGAGAANSSVPEPRPAADHRKNGGELHD